MKITTTHQGTVTIAAVSGRLDFGNAKRFQTELEQVIQQELVGKTGLVIDCQELDYVSSAGLRGFLIGARLASKGQLGFAICRLTPLVKDVFDISGFGNVFPICEELTAAVEAASQ